jgi:hypothetical protein
MQVTVGECYPKKNLVHAWSPSKRISRACLSAQGWRCSNTIHMHTIVRNNFVDGGKRAPDGRPPPLTEFVSSRVVTAVFLPCCDSLVSGSCGDGDGDFDVAHVTLPTAISYRGLTD